MHQRAHPDSHPMRTSVLFFTDQAVKSSIPVINITGQISSYGVLFHPVNFKIPKRLVIPAAYHREGVFAREPVAEELFLV